MVYCTKCGTKNNPTEKYCIHCGAPLEQSKKSLEQKIEEGAENFGKNAQKWGEEFEKQAQDGCFGLAKNVAVFGIILGIIIIIAGILLLVGIQLLRILGSIVILAFGLMILIAALKFLTKKH